MLSDREFIDRVWNKYEVYSTKENLKRNKFFMGNVYKNSHFMLFLKTCALSLLVVAVTAVMAGGVYAGVKYVVEKKDYSAIETGLERTEESIYNYQITGNSFINEADWNYEDGIRYQKINTYDEYLVFRKQYENMPEMKEEEFKENFLVVLLGRERHGIYIDGIETTEDTLIFNIKNDIDKNTSDICVKVSREKEREKIKIDFPYQMPNMTGYVTLDDLPYDYAKEKAIKDGCVVLLGDYGLSNFIVGKEKLDKFIEDSKNGINGNIRITEYETKFKHRGYETNPNGALIIDIEFKNGKYIVCRDVIRTIMNPEQYDEKPDDYKSCFITDEFEVSIDDEESYIRYDLYAKDGQNLHIYKYVWLPKD